MGVERSGKNGSFQTIGHLLSGRKMDEQRQRSRDDMRQSLVGEAMGSSFAMGQSRSNSGVGLGMASGGPLRGKQDRQELARRNLTITITCTSCMLMLYGYDFGITAWSVLLIKARGVEGVSDLYYYLATHGEALGMLVASAAVGGFAEGVWGSKTSSRRGRKAEIRFVNAICISGALLEGLSGLFEWISLDFVFVYVAGRLLYGVGLGLSLRCGPMYLRETVIGPLRNAATVSVKLSMVAGVIISYILGGLLSNPMIGYFGVAVIGGISLICLRHLPESPMFMLLHEEDYTREQILDALRFTSPEATEDDVTALQKEILTEVLAYTPGHPSYSSRNLTGAGGDAECAPCETPATVVDTGTAFGSPETCRGEEGAPDGAISMRRVFTVDDQDRYDPLDDSEKRGSVAKSMKNLPSLTKAPGMRASLLLTAGLMVFEQASGMAAILYYGGVFLADIDLISVDWGLAWLGILQLVMAIAVMYALNPIGRKPLLLYGLAGLMVSSLMLVIGGFLGISDDGRWWVLIGLYAFTASYSTSLGALVWVLVSEVFPTCHRAQAISIVSMAHFGTSAIIVILLPLLQDIGGYAAMFTCFFGVAIVANIFAHRFMVETRGLTTMEIQAALTRKAGFDEPVRPQRSEIMRSANV